MSTTTERKIATLNQLHFYFQNLRDFINNVNLGNGLAPLFMHYTPTKVANILSHKPDPKMFVSMANQNLPYNNQTDLQEVRNLLRTYHPRYEAPSNLRNYTFDLDEEGDIDPDGPYFRRILQIRNAYVKTFNAQAKYKSLYKKILTPEAAIDLAIVQLST